MIRIARLPILAVPLLFALSACDDPEPVRVDESPGADTGAKGNVLERSISDEMLPLDTVTSAPPLAGQDGNEVSDDGSEETEQE